MSNLPFLSPLLAQAVQCTGDKCDLTKLYQFSGNGAEGYSSAGQFITTLITPIFSIFAFAVLFYFIWAGFLWMTSGGDKEKISKAKGMMTHVVIGLLVLILSFLVLQFFLRGLFLTNKFNIIGLP
jgi:hypothetical protein